MSFLSGIGKALGGAIKNLGQTALRAVAPKAIDLLKGIVGTGFDGIKKLAQSALPAILPGPIGALAGKLLGPLIGKGVDALKGLTQKGIESLVNKLVDKLAPRKLENGQTVTPPTIQDRGSPQNTQAAATAFNDASNQVTSGASNSTPNFGTSGSSLEDSLVGRFPSAPNPDAVDFSDPKQAAKYQLAFQKYSQASSMITQIMQGMHDMKKEIIRNFRA